jgi:hydrogenase maturation factor
MCLVDPGMILSIDEDQIDNVDFGGAECMSTPSWPIS